MNIGVLVGSFLPRDFEAVPNNEFMIKLKLQNHERGSQIDFSRFIGVTSLINNPYLETPILNTGDIGQIIKRQPFECLLVTKLSHSTHARQ